MTAPRRDEEAGLDRAYVKFTFVLGFAAYQYAQ